MTGTGLELQGIRKAYGATQALDGVDLSIAPGEVLGVAGPNGAGKSTLVRIISGEEKADEGDGYFDSEEFDPALSVAVVHQEAQLFPNMSVGQNLMVGREPRRVMRPTLAASERDLLAHLELQGIVKWPVEQCTLAVQQRIEIARALARDARIFLFDEPNSALTERESGELFREMHQLAADGAVVLLVSHRLPDLVEHCDRVVIVRGGKVREALTGAKITEDALARALVLEGSDSTEAERGSASGDGKAVLSVGSWSAGSGAFKDVTLEFPAGTVTALTGVEGSGARELLRSLGGIESAAGSYRLDGVERSPGPGTAYVPPSRRDSLFDNFDVGQNLVARQDREITTGSIVLRKGRMRTLAKEEVSRFGVKVRNIFADIRSLSGGNQQKVAIAAAIAIRPRVLLLEEPTRGVDLSSRREIYRLLWGLAHSGCAVVIFCTETTEVFDAAGHVYVLSRGQIRGRLDVVHSHVDELASALVALEADTQKPDAAPPAERQDEGSKKEQ
jgi:ABC-type sugar transport system ATPase subunit